MYGSLICYQPKTESRAKFVALAEDWAARRGAAVGLVAEYVLEPDDQPNMVQVLAIFASKEAYRKNAADPAMDADYRALRTHLEQDPTFTDGTITTVRTAPVPL